MQDESHDHGHVHYVPQNTVFFDVRTCRRRRRGQTEGFARKVTVGKQKNPRCLPCLLLLKTQQIVVYSCLTRNEWLFLSDIDSEIMKGWWILICGGDILRMEVEWRDLWIEWRCKVR